MADVRYTTLYYTDSYYTYVVDAASESADVRLGNVTASVTGTQGTASIVAARLSGVSGAISGSHGSNAVFSVSMDDVSATVQASVGVRGGQQGYLLGAQVNVQASVGVVGTISDVLDGMTAVFVFGSALTQSPRIGVTISRGPSGADRVAGNSGVVCVSATPGVAIAAGLPGVRKLP